MSVPAKAKTTIPLAAHILKRLHQFGCSDLHGVPGDYTLPFLSYLSQSKVNWIGNGNELGAGYAADAYARVKGLGALCTTFGVGELSAINAIAGSYAERVPVVHIVGTPSTKVQKKWKDSQLGLTEYDSLVHHALGRKKSLTAAGWMSIPVVCAKRFLADAPDKAAAVFDHTLWLCMTRKMPVYIDLPSDLAGHPVYSEEKLPRFKDKLFGEPILVQEQAKFVVDMLLTITAAKRPVIVVDGLASRFGLNDGINKLVAATKIPTVVTPHGLGIVSSNHPSYYGVYTGKLGDADLHNYIQSSDCVLVFGELFSDTNTVGWTAMPPMSNSSVTTLFTDQHVTFRGKEYRLNVAETLVNLAIAMAIKTPQQAKLHETAVETVPSAEQSVSNAIEEELSASKLPSPEAILPRPSHALTNPSLSQPLTQDYLYPRLSSWLKNNDTLILANGTPLIGAKLLALPPNIRVIASGLWFSIGQMLPAAQGAALAQRSLHERDRGRTVLLEGDGSFQTTCQELSTIIRYKLDVIVLLINNEGYAYERLIQGPTEEYNDINDWDYTLAPALMGGRKYMDNNADPNEEYKIYTRKISTTLELDEVLADEVFNSKHGLKLVELQMGRLDVPTYFRPALEAAGKRLAEPATSAAADDDDAAAGQSPSSANTAGQQQQQQKEADLKELIEQQLQQQLAGGKDARALHEEALQAAKEQVPWVPREGQGQWRAK